MTDITRRRILGVTASVMLAGCTAEGAEESSEQTPDEPLADVSVGYMYGDVKTMDSPKAYNHSWETMVQATLSLREVSEDVTRVDATAITSQGNQTAAWLIPEQEDETRILGSRDVYDEDDIINLESGDYIEVRAWKDGQATLVETIEVLPGDGVKDRE